MRMPSTRNLAKQYSLSRGTVVAAFEHLQSEGYVETQVGAGSFVAANLPKDVVTHGRKENPVRRRSAQDYQELNWQTADR